MYGATCGAICPTINGTMAPAQTLTTTYKMIYKWPIRWPVQSRARALVSCGGYIKSHRTVPENRKYEPNGPSLDPEGATTDQSSSHSVWVCIAVLGRLHAWAGHLARIRQYDQHRLTLKVLDWKGMLELDTMKFLSGSQGHCGRFHAWRWEAQFHKFYLEKDTTWRNAVDRT